MTANNKPLCRIVDMNRSTVSIIGTVTRRLIRAGLKEQAGEWTQRAYACSSRDEVLRLMCEYIDVGGKEDELIDGEEEGTCGHSP